MQAFAASMRYMEDLSASFVYYSSCSLCNLSWLQDGVVVSTMAHLCPEASFWVISLHKVPLIFAYAGRGGAGAAAAAAAEHAADTAEADLVSNLPEKLDEFGRDENVELREEMSRRAHKRATAYSHPPAQPQVCCC